AADDGVKPQTKEAIEIINRLNLPFVVAMNKADKPGIIVEKVKKQLADNGVLVETMGGKAPAVLTSAKTGKGIDDLLEMILLLAEMEGLKKDNGLPAQGIVIESFLDPRRGATATLLVKKGTLFSKDIVVTESTFGSIKTMEDFRGRPIEQAGPSTPVCLTGFESAPPVGEEWEVASDIERARQRALQKGELEKKKREPAKIIDPDSDQKVFNIILKADVFGSLEVLRSMLAAIPQEEIILRVVEAEVGEINEADVKLAYSAKAKIFGFRIKAAALAQNLAARQGVGIFNFEVIYELIQAVRAQMGLMLAPEIVKEEIGQIKILAIFKQDGRRQIIGGRVIRGKAERGAVVEVIREGQNLGRGRLIQLQANKEDVDTCAKDRECGLLFDSDVRVEKGDVLVMIKEERKRREL
ncbi:MAG: GTP-binding protein, partial [Candidatus Portnoybacteria bacterium]|nr:GTP-binding protein [Candidatus Portnoybacteria bacterium]